MGGRGGGFGPGTGRSEGLVGAGGAARAACCPAGARAAQGQRDTGGSGDEGTSRRHRWHVASQGVGVGPRGTRDRGGLQSPVAGEGLTGQRWEPQIRPRWEQRAEGGGSGPPPSRHILSCDRCPGNLYPPLPERPDEHPGTAAAPCQEQPAWHSPHARTPPSPAPHTPLSSPDPQPPGVPRDARPSPGPEEGQRCCRCCRHGGEGLWCEAGGSFKGPAPAPALLWHLSPGDPTKTTPPAPTLPRCQPRQARTKPAPRPLRPRGASVPPGPRGTQSPSRWPPAQTGMVTGGKAPTKGLGGHNLSRGWQLGGGTLAWLRGDGQHRSGVETLPRRVSGERGFNRGLVRSKLLGGVWAAGARGPPAPVTLVYVRRGGGLDGIPGAAAGVVTPMCSGRPRTQQMAPRCSWVLLNLTGAWQGEGAARATEGGEKFPAQFDTDVC